MMTDPQHIRRELVTANRILAAREVVDGFGHVSVRDPDDPQRFLISRSLAPGQVTLADLMTVDGDGAVLDDDRSPFLERFIHAAIYRARTDVSAIVHSHSPSVIPFGIVRDAPLRASYHMAAFLGDGAPVFEIRETAGDGSDMLIRSAPLGAALAASLGDHAAVLMRGHGATVVGSTLRQAVFRAVYLEVAARVQTQAAALGSATYLTSAEAAAAALANDGQIDRAWNLWAQAAPTPADGQGSER